MAQDTIYYKANLEVNANVKLPLVLYIVNNSEQIIFLSSPSQSAELFKASKKKITKDSVKANFDMLSIKLRLKYENETEILQGSFRQGLLNKQITFKRTNEAYKLNRPQTPKPPFNYNIEEVSFHNPNSPYKFHGTLTYPKQNKKYPLVVLVSGSGCQNRDEEIFQHKPFMVIADYLTKQGFAVMRYDDRGYGEKDTNLYRGTTADFMQDCISAIEMLKKKIQIDSAQIFILGHSEGGAIAQMIAANNEKIKGIILMAAPMISGKDILSTQTKRIMQLQNASEKDIQQAISDINKVEFDTNSINGLWLNYFYKMNPKQYLKKIKCDVLVLQGENDVQVLADENIKVAKKILKHATIKRYNDLNHLFQHSKTGAVSEYAEIDETISEEVLQDIGSWLSKHTY